MKHPRAILLTAALLAVSVYFSSRPNSRPSQPEETTQTRTISEVSLQSHGALPQDQSDQSISSAELRNTLPASTAATTTPQATQEGLEKLPILSGVGWTGSRTLKLGSPS